MKKIITFLLLLFSLSVIGQNMTYNIDDPEALRDVIYKPGDTIILKNGEYFTDERMRFLGSGTEENPVVFRAETPGGVIFRGGARLTIGGETNDTTGEKIATGEYLIVKDFHWKGGAGASNFIEFRNGTDYAHHSTIQNCVIDGLGFEDGELEEDLAKEQIPKHRWIVLYGTYNNVINCTFRNKKSSGALILAEYAYNAFPVVPDGEEEINTSCLEVGHTIINNYFYNFEKLTELYGRKANGDELSNAGDSETIRIGTSSYQMVNSNVTVSGNYFVQADGENEIITNKSKGNIYTNNTFRKCRGSLVMRHGSYATVEGNFFLGEGVEGTGGIRISDSYHNITNNYIQDCITVEDYAKWNNGITFIGGGANADADCEFDNVSNGYQKTENIILSNNTIVNTNAPLFYNVNIDNNNDVKGAVSNNLIYFADYFPSDDLTPVISGDTPSSYSEIGVSLTYSGNVYKGSPLGVDNSGFSLETGITATPQGEIFTFSGTGANGKGANLGSNTPATDAMVGYGVGACFLNYNGINITDGDCEIKIPETLTVSPLSTLSYESGSYDVSVNANVSWTATSNDAWISINPESGTGSATLSVTVTENTETESRSGSVTFTQDPGGDNIVRVLNVTQDAPPPPDPREGLNLINRLASDVSVAYVSNEEVNSTKNNIAIHSLDKNFGTQWASNGTLDPEGSGHSIIIYDLNGAFDLDLVDIATTNNKTYFLELWVSSTGIADEDFTNAFPSEGDLISNTDASFKAFVLPSQAIGTKYVKLIGKGQASSNFTTIHEIEFYGNASSLSTHDISVNDITLFPNPVSNGVLYLNKQSNDLGYLTIYNVNGKTILSKQLDSSLSKEEIDVSSISEGLYFVEITKGTSRSVNKIIISKK